MSDDLLDRIEEQADLAAGLAPFAADALKDAADEIRRLRIVEERLSKRFRNESDRPETIAWAVIESGECHPLALFTSCADAELHASRKNDIGQRNCEAVPLYRHPTLTEAERDALVELCCTGEQSPFPRDWRAAATLRTFLERVT